MMFRAKHAIYCVVFLGAVALLRVDALRDHYRYFLASTIQGAEKVLAQEIESLHGAHDVVAGRAQVAFKGDTRTGLEAVMRLRTALRVMERIAHAEDGVATREDLYAFAGSVDWSSHLSLRNTVKCDCTLGQVEKDLSHSHFSALTVKNAISDYFRDRYNRRPDVSLEDPDLPLLLYLHRGSAMLYRVWSGDQSMHKRGYRQTVHRAALRETTAAVLLYLAGWGDRDKALLQGTSQPQTICDPMCGSGTLPIEAALMHADCAPGVVRYGDAELRPVVLSWADMEDTPGLWSDVVGEAKARDRRGLGSKAQQAPLPVIFANDIHPGAVALAKQSARLARVSSFIAFSNVNAADYSPGVGVQMAVTNPPWDLRLDGAEDSWTALGVFARREMQGSTVWALSGNPEITRHIRLKSSLKIPLSAASTQLRFLKYDVSKDD